MELSIDFAVSHKVVTEQAAIAVANALAAENWTSLSLAGVVLDLIAYFSCHTFAVLLREKVESFFNRVAALAV